MSTGSNKSLPLSPVRQSEKSAIEKLLQAGLGDFSLRELLGALLSSLAHAERGAYLQNQLDDKANGPEFWGKNTHYIDSFALRSLRSIVFRMSSCFLVRVTTREI